MLPVGCRRVVPEHIRRMPRGHSLVYRGMRDVNRFRGFVRQLIKIWPTSAGQIRSMDMWSSMSYTRSSDTKSHTRSGAVLLDIKTIHGGSSRITVCRSLLRVRSGQFEWLRTIRGVSYCRPEQLLERAVPCSHR